MMILRMKVITKQDCKPAEHIDDAGNTFEPERKWNSDGYEDCSDPK